MSSVALLLGAYLAFTRVGQLNLDPSQWEQFKRDYNKVYENKNIEDLRRTIFFDNKFKIEQFNQDLGEDASYILGINHLADLAPLEISKMNGFKLPSEFESNLHGSDFLTNSPEAQKFLDDILNDNSTEIADSIDWRNVPGRVSQVKNQGSCGSCWAFSTVGVLEGQEKVRLTKNRNESQLVQTDLVELSEQNLVDCDTNDNGCEGGYMKSALEFVSSEGGIEDERSYPYEGHDRKCRFNKSKVVLSDRGAALLPSGDEQKLKEVVAKFGPVAVAIDASALSFSLYRHGVYHSYFCGNHLKSLNHGVLVVGYGTDSKKRDFWIVKNSWGRSFGEDGYIRMSRNRRNNCGIATMATIPIF